MKTWIIIILSVICLSGSTPLYASLSYDFEYDGIYYNYNSDSISVSAEPSTYLDRPEPCFSKLRYVSQDHFYTGDIIIPELITINTDDSLMVTCIAENFLYWNGEVSSIVLPKSIESIGQTAFAHSSIEIADLKQCVNLHTLPSSAFWACYRLKKVILPDNLIEISDEAFARSTISTITIPPSVILIGREAFAFIQSLNELVIQVDNPANVLLGTDLFYQTDISRTTLYVPDESVQLYKEAPVWKDFGQILPISNKANLKGINSERITEGKFYDLLGRQSTGEKGLRISNRKKILVR